MKITKESIDEDVRYTIRGYGPGEIRINDQTYSSSLILTLNRLDTNWNPPRLENWQPHDLDALLVHDPEILLIGTGNKVKLLGTAFLAHALRHGVGLETMDTAAACRTFNILVSEGRRVAAGLLLD